MADPVVSVIGDGVVFASFGVYGGVTSGFAGCRTIAGALPNCAPGCAGA